MLQETHRCRRESIGGIGDKFRGHPRQENEMHSRAAPPTEAKKSDGAVKSNQLEADSPIRQPHPKNKGGKEKDRRVQPREIPPHVHPAESAAAAPRIRARDLAPPPLPKRLVGNSGMGGGEFQDGIAIIYQPWRNRKPQHSPHRMIEDLDHREPLPPVSSTPLPPPPGVPWLGGGGGLGESELGVGARRSRGRG